MSEIHQFKDVISFWPTAADFGRDIGISDTSARAMKRRNRIPSKYWEAVIRSAESRGIGMITHEILSGLAARPDIRPDSPPGANGKHRSSKGS